MYTKDKTKLSPIKINPVDITFVNGDNVDKWKDNSLGQEHSDHSHTMSGLNEEVEVTHIETPPVAPSTPVASYHAEVVKPSVQIGSKFSQKYDAFKRAVSKRKKNDRKESGPRRISSLPDLRSSLNLKKSTEILKEYKDSKISKEKNKRATKLQSSTKQLSKSMSNPKARKDVSSVIAINEKNNIDNTVVLEEKSNYSVHTKEHQPRMNDDKLSSSATTKISPTNGETSTADDPNPGRSTPLSSPSTPISHSLNDDSLKTSRHSCEPLISNNTMSPITNQGNTSSISDILCNRAFSFGYDNEYQHKKRLSPSRNVSMNRTYSNSSILSSNSLSNSISDGESNPIKNPYKPYYEKADFLVENWSTASEMEKAPVYGMALLVATTVIVHPIVFFAGAATAVWAVGTFHAVEQGYEFFNDGSFANLFWDDDDEMVRNNKKVLLKSDEDVTRLHDVKLRSMQGSNTKLDAVCEEEEDCAEEEKASILEDTQYIKKSPSSVEPSSKSPSSLLESKTNSEISLVETNEDSSLKTCDIYIPSPPLSPSLATISKSPLSSSITVQKEIALSNAAVGSLPPPPSEASTSFSKDSILTLDTLIKIHFPALETQLVKQVPFPGLNAEEFFDVFFSDEAPYSFKEFQKKRGDVDVEFGKWGAAAKDGRFLNNNKGNEELTSLPNAIIKERICTSRNLIKSYFGPTYTSATKTQRMTKLKNKLLVIEGRTNVKNVPFCDRFHVDERWIIESSRVSEKNAKNPIYESKLSVYVEVKFIQSCQWESKIRKSTLSSMTELIDSWCKQATAALALAEKERIKRENSKINPKDGDSTSSAAPKKVDLPTTQTKPKSEKTIQTKKISLKPSTEARSTNFNKHTPEDPEKENKKLMDLHRQKLQMLEKKIVAGDVDELGIEVQHSIFYSEKGKFATVLDPDGENQTKIHEKANYFRSRVGDDEDPVVIITPAKNKKGKKNKILSKMKGMRNF